MSDFQFYDPEQLQRFHEQKVEEMKVLMNKIVENPGKVKVDELQKATNIFGTKPTSDDEND